MSVRTIVSVLAVAFTAYLAARGFWWGTGEVDHPVVIYLALPLYLVVTWLTVFWGVGSSSAAPAATPSTRKGGLPLWACALALAVAVLVPNAILFAVAPGSRTQPFATWVIGGIGALMTIIMVRRRPFFAWAGLILAGVSISLWIGPLSALALGLVGSIVWVAAAQLLMFALDNAARDTVRLAELQQTASAWQASQSGRQRERRVQVQRALQTAGPILGRTIETGGNLRPAERLEARLAEGRLRDELRGPRLLDDVVREQLEAARRRGIAVTMLDEGGLEDLAEPELAAIRAELAEILRSASSTRLIIRTSPHEEVAVTIVGRSGEGDRLSDEDSVELWHEISRTP
ncbi:MULTISPECIES: hypothetical protein [Microbacterium]|uniref:hypothetical protein n=1 Tax=Microbacterium TaxID=33882 RepID=UPI0027E184A3|nr:MULTISPECIES: hypothetical protein [Microbacterium]